MSAEMNKNPWAHAAMPDVLVYTRRQLDAAVAAERERCAKLCDEYESGGQDWAAIAALELAAAIRGPNIGVHRQDPALPAQP